MALVHFGFGTPVLSQYLTRPRPRKPYTNSNREGAPFLFESGTRIGYRVIHWTPWIDAQPIHSQDPFNSERVMYLPANTSETIECEVLRAYYLKVQK